MGDATTQTVYFYDRHIFMIGIRFHSTSYLQSCARAAVTLMVCGQMICFHMTRIIMAA